MENSNNEFTLPPAPRGLCFDRNDFVKTNFSVDNFLLEHQEVVSLETMRDDLGIYLKVLRLAMIELINKDYANFVNLCATLIGFDKAIIKIEIPLIQLNEEVLSVKQCLEDAMKELSLWLNQRHALLKKKQLLKYYSFTVNCLSTLDVILSNIADRRRQEQIIIADRAAMQTNQLKFSITKCESLIKPGHKKFYNEVCGKLVQTLNDLLFQFWNDNNEENLLKTLLTLASLDRVSETEMLVRKQAVVPLLQDIISEPALQRNKDGLMGVYNKILSLLNNELKLLYTVTQHSKFTCLLKKYQFIVHCFWCEVENRLEVNLASIFAPGNPQLFFRRYNESMNFISRLEEYCTTKEVELLHNTPEYKSFLRRWNLPVYFQIRFQEIAGGFEATLKSTATLEINECFTLAETYKCWISLQNCWAEGVYIEAIAHKFWKLSLQLISRYATWIIGICSQPHSSHKQESTGINRTLIEYCVHLYLDTEMLLQMLPSFLEDVKKKLPKNYQILQDSLKPSEELLQRVKSKICECIVNELFEHFNVLLKQVSDIPRLYRKTNRNIPTKPCTYIDSIGNLLNEYNGSTFKKLDNAFLVNMYEALFNVMTISYFKYVEDVLTSVQRTEESLRRLKQIREKTPQQTNDVTGVTDGDKIRLQLNVDVCSFNKLAKSLNIDVKRIQNLTELTSMVTDAVKNIDIK